MELFERAKAVRLRSHHGKYLKADGDEEHVTQSRNGSAPGVRWEVEFLPECSALRLRSCHGRYLAASAEPFLLGVTGKKVVQLQLSPSLDPNPPCLKWEPIREGFQVKLKSHTGKFLRANGSLPPWRNSVTHDLPQRTATQDWVLWDVDVVEIQPSSAPAAAKPTPSRAPAVSIKRPPSRPSSPPRSFAADFSSPSGPSDPDDLHEDSSSSTSSSISDSSPRANAIHSPPSSTSQSYPSFAAPAPAPAPVQAPALGPVPPPSVGRTIYYTVADDRGNVDDDEEWPSLTFVGTSVSELTRMLKKLTMLDDIIVCTRYPPKHNLSPIYLNLPPNNRAMRLVVVDADSSFGRSFDI